MRFFTPHFLLSWSLALCACESQRLGDIAAGPVLAPQSEIVFSQGQYFILSQVVSTADEIEAVAGNKGDEE